MRLDVIKINETKREERRGDGKRRATNKRREEKR